jgi:hypothetical protein
MTISVPDEGNNRNVSWLLSYIYKFLLYIYIGMMRKVFTILQIYYQNEFLDNIACSGINVMSLNQWSLIYHYLHPSGNYEDVKFIVYDL